MRHVFKSTLLLVIIAGLVTATGYSTFAEEQGTPTQHPPVQMTRTAASIWTYQTEIEEAVVEETTLEDGTAEVIGYALKRNTTSRIYFKDQGADKLWNILFLTKEDKREVGTSQPIPGMPAFKPLPEDRIAKVAMIGGPWSMMVKTDDAGVINTTATDVLTDKEWTEAVLSHLRTFPVGGFKSGTVWSGKVIVEGKEVGEFENRGLVITAMGATNWATSGSLKATNPTTGKVIDIRRFNSTWVPEKNVPSYENFQYTITETKGKTKYTTIGRMSNATVNEDMTTPLPLRILTGKDLDMMNAQYKAFEVGFKALKEAKPITVETINAKTTAEDKNLALATKSFFDAWQQWPQGPFAEDMLTMADNFNLVAWGSVLSADVNKPAPAFRAPQEQKYWYNSKPIPHTALNGKVVIIEIFGPDCPPCRKNVPHLNALYDKFAKQGLVIIGMTNYAYAAVNKKKPYTIEDIVNGLTDYDGSKIEGARYPIVGDTPSFKIFDENGNPMWSEARKAQAVLPQAMLAFQPASGIPHAFIIDQKGMVVWRGYPASITEQGIERLLKGEEKKAD